MNYAARFASAALVGLLASYAPHTLAATVGYTDFASWNSAVSLPIVVENFEDTTLNPLIASATFASASGSISLGAFNDIVQPNGADASVFTFSKKLTALGAYWDLSPGGPGVALNLYADGTLVSAGTPTIPNTSTGQFWGFTSTVAFNQLEIKGDGSAGSQETYRIPDMYMKPVPLPAALPLFLSAVAGLGVFGRRKGSA